jgi:NAD(P)-dependent dehydrogenase (short-subunit alcohol dehydrogenase family)
MMGVFDGGRRGDHGQASGIGVRIAELFASPAARVVIAGRPGYWARIKLGGAVGLLPAGAVVVAVTASNREAPASGSIADPGLAKAELFLDHARRRGLVPSSGRAS